MLHAPGTGGRWWLSRRTLIILTNIISIACLVWVFYDLNWRSLVQDLREMSWWWVLFAVVSDVLVYVWQGYRWSLLLKPVTPVSVWQCVRAIYVGLFANEVLPLRSGEIIRCYLQARWSKLPFTVVLSSALIERMFDGIWLVLLFFVTTRFVPLPKYLIDAGWVLLVILILAAAILAWVMFHRHHARATISNNRFLKGLQVLVDDLHLIGNSRQFYLAAIASLPFLLLQVVPVYALFRGYGLDSGIGDSFVLIVILRLGTVIPQMPGNLGAFQALTVLSLRLSGFDMGVAKRFSVILWGVITLPLLIAGFIALAITELKIGELHREANANFTPEKDAVTDK